MVKNKTRNPILKRAGEMLIPLAEEAGRELITQGISELTSKTTNRKTRPLTAPQKTKGLGHSRDAFISLPATEAVAFSGAPKVRRDGADSSVIGGRVLIGHLDIPASGFDFSMLRINAANARMFPQLAVAATLFTQYKFTKLKFIFTNPGHPTTSSGQFVAGVSYDTTPESPFTKEEIFNRTDSVKAPVWQPVTELCCTNLPQKWCLLEAQVASGSRQSVDVGNLVIGGESLGGPALENATEVMVEYTCVLKARRPDVQQDFTTATNSIILMAPVDGSYSSGTYTYPSWFSPFNCIVNPHMNTFAGIPDAGFYLPSGFWLVKAQFQWFAGAGVSDYTVTISLMRNRTTPVTIGTQNNHYSAAIAAEGTMTVIFYAESEGRSISPENDPNSDDSCFALRFFQNSGVTVGMYGSSHVRRRSLVCIPL
jgi:hypothetical protein